MPYFSHYMKAINILKLKQYIKILKRDYPIKIIFPKEVGKKVKQSRYRPVLAHRVAGS